MIKTFSHILLVFLGVTWSILPKTSELESKESTVFLSSDDSFLSIKGTTNVSTFECQFDMTALSKAIKVNYNNHDEGIKFNNTSLLLPNKEFDCGGRIINKDFNELLNTDEYPEITLQLKEVSKLKSDTSSVAATIEIHISNISRTYTVPVFVSHDNGLHVSGVMPLDINDFNLTAPTKMLGMVKVSPEIEIQFSLRITDLETF